MAAGLSRPTSGSLAVLGETPDQRSPALLSRMGYLDQERPLYLDFGVDEMMRFGTATNETWDGAGATAQLGKLAIPRRARVGSLSMGQRAQVALTMFLTKGPDPLILDEPAASLDPVAHEDLLQLLLAQVTEHSKSDVLSTHAMGDVAAVCDYLVIVSHARVVLPDDVAFVLGTHRLVTTARLSSGAVVRENIRVQGYLRRVGGGDTAELSQCLATLGCRDVQIFVATSEF